MKLNLVIDASGIFYRSLFTVGSYGSRKGQRLLESEDSKGVFIRKLATDFAALVKSVENVNRVIVCLDSSSWRKKIEIEDGGYKSKRKEKKEEDNKVDWDAFFKLTQEFTEILASKGYILSRVKEAEADDLLFLWAKKLNSLKEAVILVTGDKDLHQVINLNQNGAWTVALDPVANRRKVILSQEIYDICNKDVDPGDVDIFDPSTWTDSPGDVLFSLVDKNDVQILDPVKVATMKVLQGDGGDDVPGIVSWMDKNKHGEDVLRSLSENKISKAIADMPEFTWQELQSGMYTKELTSNLIKVSKRELTEEYIQKNIERNIKLVVLDEAIIPQEIQNRFRESVEKIESSPVHLTRDTILDGTKWWKDKGAFVPKGYDFAIEDTFFDGESKPNESSSEDREALNKAIADITGKNNDKKGSTALF